MFLSAFFIVAIHLLLTIACLIAKPRRKHWSREKVVYLPFYLALAGMVCGTVLGIPTVVCAMDHDWMFAFFGGVTLMCDAMMAAYLNCVIRYDDNGFTAGNLLGIRRTCRYEEVEKLRSGRDSRIYFRGHCVLIDGISYGREDFLVAVEKGYRRATGRWVPAHKKKWDPMNGHLEHPWLYFILWVVIGLFCAALPLVMYHSMTSETDPSDITLRQVQFSRYRTDGSSLMLYAEGDDTPYEIAYYERYEAVLPTAEKLCSGETYTVGVEKDRHYVKSLTSSAGIRHITLESERQVYRDSQRTAVWFLSGAFIAGVYFSYMGIAVARHPERYSEKVRRLFYKDGFLL